MSFVDSIGFVLKRLFRRSHASLQDYITVFNLQADFNVLEIRDCKYDPVTRRMEIKVPGTTQGSEGQLEHYVIYDYFTPSLRDTLKREGVYIKEERIQYNL